MPSVYATWSGSCRDAAARRQLLDHVEALAAVSHAYLDDRPLLRYGGRLEGPVLINAAALPAQPASIGLTVVSDTLCALDHASLEGIEFRLFDGRGLYPDEDRMSFVFLVNDNPALDGCLVYVENEAECQKYSDPAVRTARWYLGVPNIHLRYYLEDWLDLVMAWVKRYFIPDLSYWRHSPRLEDARALAEMFGTASAGDVLPTLIDLFRSEVGGWEGRAEDARRFYAQFGRPARLMMPPPETLGDATPDAGQAEEVTALGLALQRALRERLGTEPDEQTTARLWDLAPPDGGA
jgi:hypothetical protein